MVRKEVRQLWGGPDIRVVVVPIVNVEASIPEGLAIQPHLRSDPEIANRGWRDYGNRQGLKRLVEMTRSLDIPATAVANSDALQEGVVTQVLTTSGWEIGAHGINNSVGDSGMDRSAEKNVFSTSLSRLEAAFGSRPRTWLTPGFSVTSSTAERAARAGVKVLLDFTDDDVPYELVHEADQVRILCLPYSLETNDVSLVLSLHHSPESYARAVEEHVLQLADEPGATKVVLLGMHTFLAGAPARARTLKQALRRLKAASGVKFATTAEVYRMIKQ
jgi:peptidoglycan/xylan/chitin deacetylase (PgdA/CDA1 family)